FAQPGVNAQVNAVAVIGGNVYIGGAFVTASDVVVNKIAMWNGSTWSALSTGLNGTVYTLAVSGTDLYVGGDFTKLSGTNTFVYYIAKWSTTSSSWSALGSGSNIGVGAPVRAIAVSGTDVYVGGQFVTAGGTLVSANRIAKWNGSTWSALGSGMNAQVSAIAVSGTTVYAGGQFTTADGSSTNYIATWNGSAWSSFGSGANNGVSAEVSAIGISGTDVYVGGWFTLAGGASIAYLAKWNGTSWSAVGGGVNGRVNTITVNGSDVYVGGLLSSAGGSTVNKIAKWDGSSWSALVSGVGPSSGAVYSIAVDGSDVYAGGTFFTASTAVGSISAIRIAKYDGTTWHSMASGRGLSDLTNAVAVGSSGVYAGGQFSTAGGIPASNVAKWNGTIWSSLGTGLNGTVNAIAVSGTDVYIGGSFTTAGGLPASRIAKWDGSTWSALGSGVDNTVNAIAVNGTDVYIGGSFTTAGILPANRIAKWDGSSWSALGSGVDNTVNAIAISGSSIYVGGSFTTAGILPANRIAKWDGSSWSALGSGVDNTVRAIAVSGADVYVGGSFTTAGSYIAKWDGSTWLALGSGLNGTVNGLAVSGADAYVAGSFTAAGGKVSHYFGIWHSGSVNYAGPSNTAQNNLQIRVDSPSSGTIPTIDFHNFEPTTGTRPSGIDHVSKYYWTITASGLTFSNGKISVPLADLVGVTPGQEDKLRWLKRTNPGDAWTNIGGIINGSNLENTVAFIGFSEFAIGSTISLPDDPLPVELSAFSGSSTSAGVKLNWTTQSETDNAGFVILRNGQEIASYLTVDALKGQGSKGTPTNYTYMDTEGELGLTYTYKLRSIDRSGKTNNYSQTVTARITEAVASRASVYALSQNYPNPFNPSTIIRFSMQQAGVANVTVYDLLGRAVVSKILQATKGWNEYSFNGAGLGSGVYFYRLTVSGKYDKTMKMMLVK
ncbi:MAG: T9SS type A sorting domain-containing protein, partial [Chlorobiales bacterium]|nr:T9SS type A sorting domain-containing protein [Chlorobiales bacterium]